MKPECITDHHWRQMQRKPDNPEWRRLADKLPRRDSEAAAMTTENPMEAATKIANALRTEGEYRQDMILRMGFAAVTLALLAVADAIRGASNSAFAK